MRVPYDARFINDATLEGRVRQLTDTVRRRFASDVPVRDRDFLENLEEAIVLFVKIENDSLIAGERLTASL